MEKEEIVPYKISEIKQITHDARQFTFPIVPERKFDFLPGDFMKVYPDPSDSIEFRTYTPTTTPDTKDRFELIIKRYPLGMVSKFMHDRKVGDEVWFSGPHEGGHFVEGMAKHLGLVAGGTGITPFISIIRTILQRNFDVELSLLFANKTVADIILREEFDEYDRERENFSRYYVVDKAPPGWTMGVGRIDEKLMREKLPAPSPDTTIFLCGPPMMQIELQKKLIEIGHDKDRIIFP
jgi:cytochrome-b5 reductase